MIRKENYRLIPVMNIGTNTPNKILVISSVCKIHNNTSWPGAI